MCFAIPGKVIEVNKQDAVVDYNTEKRKVKNYLNINLGDWVIVSNKIIIKKVPENEALESIKLIKNNQDGISQKC